MLYNSLREDITASLKRGDKMRLETIRFLVAAIRNFAIAKYGAQGEAGLTDADVLDVVKKQVKTHKESIDAFGKAGRTELVQKEQDELAILSSFLPKELSDEELKALLADVVSKTDPNLVDNWQNFGLLMKAAMAKVQGQADGGRVSAMLKQLLQK